MKLFVIVPTLLVACAAEASFPIAARFLPSAGLYRGGLAARYAAAPYAARFAAAPAHTYPIGYAAPHGLIAATSHIAHAPIATAHAAPIAHIAAAPIATAHAAPIAIAHAAPIVTAHAAPIAAPITGPVSSQFHSQDEFGNIAYGYSNINSAKEEHGNALTGVTGSYTYVDEAGQHTVNYVADGLGFRVATDSLPVAPVYTGVAPVHAAVAPVAPLDTPAVVAARSQFFDTFNAQKLLHRMRRSVITPYAGLGGYGYAGLGYAAPAIGHINPAAYTAAIAPAAYNTAIAPVAHHAAIAAPIAHHAAIAAPIAYNTAAVAAPGAARDAVLTTIKLNPGHAVFYRVD